jgi:4-hydroxy-3-polyprenylbenzoate decarboxylase
MAPHDLQEFLFELEKRKEVLRIREPVSPDLEISFFTQEVSRRRGPALIFEAFSPPVFTNAFGSIKRMCVALGINDAKETGDVFRDFSSNPERYKPRVIDSSPSCQELQMKGDEIDILSLPMIKVWPKDAAPSITLPVVITKDPETGRTNAGIYRLQAFDRKTTGLHWRKGSGGERHYALHKKMGKKMEVAVAIGPSPSVTFAASAPLRRGLEELSFAGYFGGMSVEMARCLTIDLEVPASSQIVLEGYVDHDEKMWEGPFGNHTGYYDPGGEYPVFHTTCITMR